MPKTFIPNDLDTRITATIENVLIHQEQIEEQLMKLIDRVSDREIIIIMNKLSRESAQVKGVLIDAQTEIARQRHTINRIQNLINK